LLTLLLIWTAALALPLVAAPSAQAMMKTPCPMETSGMSAAAHANMDCCEHGNGGSEQKAPCKPGMACFATAAALPASSVEVAVVSFEPLAPVQSSTRALQSIPPDRTLRPPIAF
jgi:hypothetical protein